jgi:ABC-type transport system involved in multi-copper enzyme maturation permease subunit
MTTITIVPSTRATAREPRFAGLGALVHKELMEWRRGLRFWVVLGVTTTFLALTAAAAWITEQVRLAVPPDVTPPAPPPSLDGLDNLVVAAVTGVPVLAAIFAVISLLVGERESGTLAWTASKPVALRTIWLAKWVVASTMLAVAAVIVPVLVTVLVATGLYGAPPIGPVLLITLGLVMTTTLFAAVGLAAGVVLRSQAAIAAVGLGVFLVPSLLVGLVPGLAAVLPTSILTWSVEAAMGGVLTLVTPITWVATILVLAGLAMRRMDRTEL